MTLGTIAVCIFNLFNLWDLKREAAADREEVVKLYASHKRKAVYFKPCAFIYPKERQEEPGYSR